MAGHPSGKTAPGNWGAQMGERDDLSSAVYSGLLAALRRFGRSLHPVRSPGFDQPDDVAALIQHHRAAVPESLGPHSRNGGPGRMTVLDSNSGQRPVHQTSFAGVEVQFEHLGVRGGRHLLP
jgi:hypothetical protein